MNILPHLSLALAIFPLICAIEAVPNSNDATIRNATTTMSSDMNSTSSGVRVPDVTPTSTSPAETQQTLIATTDKLGLGEKCNATEERPCADFNATCSDGICQCQAGFVEDFGICKVAVGWSCSNDSDCLNNSTCKSDGNNSTCTCKEGFTLDDITKLCKLPAGSSCSSTPECVSHSNCTGEGNVCTCYGGLVADDLTGLCKLPAGGTCANTTACVSHSNCTGEANTTCTCFIGFVPDFTGLCKVPAGGECTRASNCLSNANCTGEPGKCTCDPEYVEENGLCKVPTGGGCTDTTECVSHAECNGDPGGNCTCKQGYVAGSGYCKVNVGENCTFTTDCPSNAECFEGKCNCTEGHVEEHGKCKVELGENCTISTDCPSNAECTEGKCNCTAGHVEEHGKCRLPMVGENCTNTTGCATEYAECAAGTPGNMTCNCKNGYVLVGTECKSEGGLGSPCESEKDCEVENSSCNEESGKRTCSCRPGYKKDEEICRLPNLGEECQQGPGCATPNATCAFVESEGMMCKCVEGYYQDGKICKLNTGGGRRGLSGGAIFAIILVVGILASIIGFLVHASIYRPDRVLAIKRRLGIVRPITDRVEYDTL